MRSQDALDDIAVPWRNLLARSAADTRLVGLTDDRTLIVLCAEKSPIKAQLEARKSELLKKLNQRLAPARRLSAIELREGGAGDLTAIELLQSIRVDVARLATRVDALQDALDSLRTPEANS